MSIREPSRSKPAATRHFTDTLAVKNKLVAKARNIIRERVCDATLVSSIFAAELIHETFGPEFDAKRFLTPIPNKNTSVRDGLLWTHGSSGGKCPPMVYPPVERKHLTVFFYYWHLVTGGWLWFFVDDGLWIHNV